MWSGCATARFQFSWISLWPRRPSSPGRRSWAFLQLQTKQYYTFPDEVAAAQEALRIGAELTKRGLRSVRHRAEAMFECPVVPRTDAEAKNGDATRYFEMHLKVMTANAKKCMEAKSDFLRALSRWFFQ